MSDVADIAGRLTKAQVRNIAMDLRFKQQNRCGPIQYHMGYDTALNDILQAVSVSPPEGGYE